MSNNTLASNHKPKHANLENTNPQNTTIDIQKNEMHNMGCRVKGLACTCVSSDPCCVHVRCNWDTLGASATCSCQ